MFFATLDRSITIEALKIIKMFSGLLKIHHIFNDFIDIETNIIYFYFTFANLTIICKYEISS